MCTHPLSLSLSLSLSLYTSTLNVGELVYWLRT